MEPVTPLAPGPIRYERHRPETTLLYQLVERHYLDFMAALAEQRRSGGPTAQGRDSRQGL